MRIFRPGIGSTIRVVSLLLITFAGFLVSTSDTNLPSLGITLFGVSAGLLLILFKSSGHIFKLPGDTILWALAWISWSIASTTQAITAVNLPSGMLELYRFPGSDFVYILLASATVYVGLNLVIRNPASGQFWSALLGASVWSSGLFFRSFVVREAGPIYGSIGAFLLLAYFSYKGNLFSKLFTSRTLSFWRWAFFYSAILLLSALLSPSVGESLGYWLRMVLTLFLAAFLTVGLSQDPHMKKFMVWTVIILAGIVPTVWSISEMISLGISLDWETALRFRLHPTEMGGGNLIARMVLCAVPLAIVQLSENSKISKITSFFARKGLVVLVIAGMIFTIFQSVSWVGRYAFAISTIALVILVFWNVIWKTLKSWFLRIEFRVILLVMFALSLTLVVTEIIKAAPNVNIYSFNARQIHWKGSLLTTRDNLLLGGGPGNKIIYTKYTGDVRATLIGQQLLDDPLYTADLPRTLAYHSHNLLLEIVATTGLIGLIAFLIMLYTLLHNGIQQYKVSESTDRWLMAACLAGISGELAWGVLDVLFDIPPFFSFPIWILLGLLLASPSSQDNNYHYHENKPTQGWHHILRLALVIFIVLLPSWASKLYASGYTAFQEQRWLDAKTSLRQSTLLNFLDAEALHMLGQAYIQLGEWNDAETLYINSLAIKKEYSPFLYRLGWLARKKNNHAEALSYFKRAIDSDPYEIWQKGLYSSAALTYISNGQLNEAIKYLTLGGRVSPTSFPGTEWVKVENREGKVELILDPVYSEGSSEQLNKRIDMWLGVADINSRQFEISATQEQSLSYSDFLEYMFKEAQKFQDIDPLEQSIWFSSLAEISGNAGYIEEAEFFLDSYRRLNPKSAYSDRRLAEILKDRGQLNEAREYLTKALTTSPTNITSKYQLLLIDLQEKKWSQAFALLTDITKQKQNDNYEWHVDLTELYDAWAEYYRNLGDWQKARSALSALAMMRSGPGDYLLLAEAERVLALDNNAEKSCVNAMNAAIRMQIRPLDPILVNIASCFTSPSNMPEKNKHNAFIFYIIEGHYFKHRNQPVNAIKSYRNARDLRRDEAAPALFMANVYESSGQYDEAEKYYIEAFNINSREPLPLLLLGKMLESRGNFDQALLYFQKLIKVSPGWDEAQVSLANIYMTQGDLDLASGYLKRAQLSAREYDDRVFMDLISQLPYTSKQVDSIGRIYTDFFTIGNQRLPVIFMHPESEAVYQISLPSDKPLKFVAYAALSPESWTRPGDGVEFEVKIQTSTGQVVEIFNTVITPQESMVNKSWTPIEIDLKEYSGMNIKLVLHTHPGYQNNYNYDWAGWGTPRLILK